MSGERVLVERDGHVAHVRLNRPEKRNAIDSEMLTQLREVARSWPRAFGVGGRALGGGAHLLLRARHGQPRRHGHRHGEGRRGLGHGT